MTTLVSGDLLFLKISSQFGSMINDPLSAKVLEKAFHIHTMLGPGLLESTYQKFLFEKLRRDGITVLSEVTLPIDVEGIRVDRAFRLDLIVDSKLVVEIKSVSSLTQVHFQ